MNSITVKVTNTVHKALFTAVASAFVLRKVNINFYKIAQGKYAC